MYEIKVQMNQLVGEVKTFALSPQPIPGVEAFMLVVGPLKSQC